MTGTGTVSVVVETHPIPEHYAQVHSMLSSRDGVLTRADLMETPQARVEYE